jgi:uncharacterized membrane protein YgcG
MRRTLAAVVAIVIGVAVTLASGAAAGAERILSYRSDIAVGTDGSVDVRETIAIVAEGSQIRHGIYRDFPTDYRDSGGRRVRVAFDIAAIRRDGQPEPYHTERLANGVRIYIGDKDVLIEPGQHTYVIEYRTSRQLGYFPQYDELYWNVTGNGWVFPIERVEALIHLPPGATVIQSAGYTGFMGQRGADVEVVRSAPGQIAFRTTRPLRAFEGLTVAVAWPKGFVAPPAFARRLGWFLLDYLELVAPAASALLVLLYYGIAWWLVGRDPRRGVIIPRFEPPADLSPSAARYVRRMGFDDTVMAAGVVGLAVKGCIKITDEPDSDVYRLDRRHGEVGKLLPVERELLDRLFPWEGALILNAHDIGRERKDAIRERIAGARLTLENGLAREHLGTSFAANTPYLIGGIGLSAAFLLVIYVLVLVPGTGLLGFAGVASYVGAMIATTYVSWRLLKAPTAAGRRLLDELEGFRRYLGFAEKERLAILHPPDLTPELYERYLPYALALDVENEWSEQFADALAKSGHRYQDYRPDWYAGRPWRSDRGTIDVGRRMAVALPVAIAASAAAPGSSRSGGGSSGGGSSGGGGGGGGGGGW